MEMEMEVETPSKCLTFLCVSWKLCKCIFSHVTLVVLVVAYSVLGAYAFEQLESENEIKVKRSIKDVRGNVTEGLWTMTNTVEYLRRENWTDDVVEKLRDFETDLLRKMKKEGWDGNEEEDNIQWTFAGALFYSIIVITTIGYGHLVPKTPNGKILTIFYAILGIPLMLFFLSSIGDVMASSFRFVYWKICCYICTRPPKPIRRVRSGNMVRGYSVRQGSGRIGSTRATSFRRSVRASQRSADSALGLSETMTRSLQSDTGYKYQPPRRFDAVRNINDLTIKRTTLPSTASPRNIYPTGPTRHTFDSPSNVKTSRVSGRAPATISGTTQSLDRRLHVALHDVDRMSVFFNKYALVESDFPNNNTPTEMKREYSTLPRSGPRSSPRRCRSVDPELINDQTMYLQVSQPRKIGSHGGRSSPSSTHLRRHRREPPSPRIMSPMGFAVHRQTYPDDIEYDDYSMPAEDQAIKPVPIWLCVFLVVSYILGGAVLFNEWESWLFLDSAYFCFITLTTIGFGDFVPAHRLNKHQGIAICSIYLLVGIALLAMSFNLVQEEVIANVKSVAKRLGIIKEEEDDDDDDNDEDDMEKEIEQYDVGNYDCNYTDYTERSGYYNNERDFTTT